MTDVTDVDPMAAAAEFDHVGISVADLDAATDWYCRALGLVVGGRFQIPGTELSGAMLLHPTGYRIELLHRPDSVVGLQADHPNTAAATRGFGHICLRVTDVDAMHAQLVDAGATTRMPPRPSPRPGSRMCFVSDPEGNLIEVLDRN